MYGKHEWQHALEEAETLSWDDVDINEGSGPLAKALLRIRDHAPVDGDTFILQAAIEAAHLIFGAWDVTEMDNIVKGLAATLHERPAEPDAHLVYIDGGDGYVYAFARPIYKTTDGVDIVEGLKVLTNELRWGVIRKPVGYTRGWFDVDYPDGGGTQQNGERLRTTPMPGMRS